MVNFENLKLPFKQCYQTCNFFIGQKLEENAKIQKFKCVILSDFKQCFDVQSGKVFRLVFRQ